MAGPTFIRIGETVLGAAQQEVTFSGISTSYGALAFYCSFKSTDTTSDFLDYFYMRFNGNAAGYNNRTWNAMVDAFNATSYATSSFSAVGGAGNRAILGTTFGSNATSYNATQARSQYSGHIFPSNSSSQYKYIISSGGSAGTRTTNGYMRNQYGMGYSIWANTAQITSVSFGLNSSTFVVGSTFTLYGLAS